MELMLNFLVCLALASIVSWSEVRAQTSNTSKSLDAFLQDYAYRALAVNPRTGKEFIAQVPSNFSGIKAAALRLRSGSLRSKGVDSYEEFRIPVGVIVRPYVVRLVLVYQNLGNWSEIYYRVPGYTFAAPVVGLLAYDATNLSATNLQELDIRASKEPISIHFNVTAPTGLTPKCIWFSLNGTTKFSNLTSASVCSTSYQGHFSIVVESIAPAPAPAQPPKQGPVSPGGGPSAAKKDKSRVWKIAAPVVGGSAVLVLFALLVVWLQKYRQNKRMEEMERQAEIGEALQMTSIGDSRAPMAVGTRTPPMLENEYVP